MVSASVVRLSTLPAPPTPILLFCKYSSVRLVRLARGLTVMMVLLGKSKYVKLVRDPPGH